MPTDPMAQVTASNGDVPSAQPAPHQDCSPSYHFDEQFHLVVRGTDLPLSHAPYRISASNGEIFEGISDENGFTERVKTLDSARLTIEIFSVTTEKVIGDE